MSSAKRGDALDDERANGGRPSTINLLLRAFPWFIAIVAAGAGAAAIVWLQSFEATVDAREPAEGATFELEASTPSPIMTNPHSPYAHLQDQVVPRDMRTIHEGGPVGLLAIDANTDHKPFCDESHWSRVAIVEEVDGEQVFVDQTTWKRMPVGTRAQLASWMSKCKRQGDSVEIYGEGSGALLATYHPDEGLALLD
jgi:hypothetical protein